MSKLIDYSKDYGIDITEEMAEKFDIYSDFLIEYNEKVNLTAITNKDDILIKHFLDSLLLLVAYEVPQNATLIDVGTGAGFPAVPIKIVRPDISVTLLDSLQKRLVFLEELGEKLGQKNKLIHSRAEHCALETPFRDGYDIVTSRAVANLPVLCEYCLPFTSVGEAFIALKGPNIKEEIEKSSKALHLLGGKLESQKQFVLPTGEERNILVIRKIAETSNKYPRQKIKISKSPL